MSTRQIGQRLLDESHWSTHSTWNRCIQGRRLTSSESSNSLKQMPGTLLNVELLNTAYLTSSESSNSLKQMVHFSTLSSSSGSSLGLRMLLYLCGNVVRSMTSCVAPRLICCKRRCSTMRI
uniref:Uncharacterized protein n=1 Tax=Cacopsylla melanoneura TaxID=428564 RepID=A0A8D8YJT9_9HEMI